jgi:serine/threonine protein kinase
MISEAVLLMTSQRTYNRKATDARQYEESARVEDLSHPEGIPFRTKALSRDSTSAAGSTQATPWPSERMWASEQTSNMAEEYEVRAASFSMGEVVGKGATAEVFEATLRGQQVAVKRLLPSADNSVLMARERAFIRELEVLSQARHQGILQLVGVVTVERPICLVTELCQGGNLFDLLHMSDVELRWHQQLKMASDVADAMNYLHSLRPLIIHRDLKSPNVLVSLPVISEQCVPQVKVADFGLARMGLPGFEMTAKTGTSNWMAPEVAVGSRYDHKADVFSYGMLLFEIVCLEVPFEESLPHEVTALIASGARPDENPEALPPDCPESIAELMSVCWAQDPTIRPEFCEVSAVLSQICPPD